MINVEIAVAKHCVKARVASMGHQKKITGVRYASHTERGEGVECVDCSASRASRRRVPRSVGERGHTGVRMSLQGVAAQATEVQMMQTGPLAEIETADRAVFTDEDWR